MPQIHHQNMKSTTTNDSLEGKRTLSGDEPTKDNLRKLNEDEECEAKSVPKKTEEKDILSIKIFILMAIFMQHNEDGKCKAKSVPKKPNSFPIMIVILMAIFMQVRPSESKEIKCSSNQIAWKNKTTNKIEACTTCPPCAPSQQYTIPCGAEVYIGTEGRCVDCPSGMYSDALDTNPCVPCTVCTNRKVLQNCTSSQNAICGKCNKGYVYDPVIFDCIPVKTQATIKPAQPATKPRTPLPSTPPSALPIATTLKTSPPTIQATTILPVIVSTVKDITMWKTTEVTSKDHNADSANALRSSTHDNNGMSTEIIVTISILGIVIFILVTCIIIFYNKFFKRSPNCQSTCGNHRDEEESIMMVVKADDGQLLKDFMFKNYEHADKICKLLLRRRFGKWDFEKVASKWSIKEEDVLAIKSQLHADGGSPVRELCELLCSSIPNVTVQKFAESLKDINKEAYGILISNFQTAPQLEMQVETEN